MKIVVAEFEYDPKSDWSREVVGRLQYDIREERALIGPVAIAYTIRASIDGIPIEFTFPAFLAHRLLEIEL